MSQAHEPFIVLTDSEEHVELINRTLRDAGHAVRCHWIDSVDRVGEALAEHSASMLWMFPDGDLDGIAKIARIRTEFGAMVPLIVVMNDVNEASIVAAMNAGAQDLVSMQNTERLCKVAERELRAFRLERALSETLESASEYRKQLTTLKAGTENAIGCAQEGVLVEANQAWARLLGRDDPDELIGLPLMDFVELGSRTTLKGGLMACANGQWNNNPLRITALSEGGATPSIEIWLEQTVFDGEAAVLIKVNDSKSQVTEPQQLVEETVHRDPMTGFYHRRHFVEMLTERLKSNPHGGVRALAYLRPDNFGDIKDDIGPLASEDVLIQLAEVLRGLTQPKDIYGRFGGVVFTILLERGTLRDVEAWAENAITTISDHLFEIAGKTVSVTCTLGLTEVTRGADRIESIVIDAEQANHRGRQRGGNQVVLAEISDDSTRIRRFDLVWVDKIKSALLNNNLQLVHLPIVSLSGEEGTRFDTVMRMLDEEGEEVPATEFMPAAERHSMLKTIDRWVIGASLAYAEENKPDLLLIKLSKESIVDLTLLDWLESELKRTVIDAGSICFQVSEEVVNRHLKQARELSVSLSELGFKFAIEHFGISRDPMRILNNVPMNYLKIDGSLMQSISSNQTRQDEVQKFASAARHKEIATIAERIEDANSMAVLFQLGIGYMQGHYVREAEVVLEEAAAPTPIVLGQNTGTQTEAPAPADTTKKSAEAPLPEKPLDSNARVEHDTTRGPQLTLNPAESDAAELELAPDEPSLQPDRRSGSAG
jgi:diguanylate cyclase (GGDEF)-like protein